MPADKPQQLTATATLLSRVADGVTSRFADFIGVDTCQIKQYKSAAHENPLYIAVVIPHSFLVTAADVEM